MGRRRRVGLAPTVLAIVTLAGCGTSAKPSATAAVNSSEPTTAPAVTTTLPTTSTSVTTTTTVPSTTSTTARMAYVPNLATFPKYSELNLPDGEQVLEAVLSAGFQYQENFVTEPYGIPPGLVVSMSPAGGSIEPYGSTVTLWLSSNVGAETTTTTSPLDEAVTRCENDPANQDLVRQTAIQALGHDPGDPQDQQVLDQYCEQHYGQ